MASGKKYKKGFAPVLILGLVVVVGAVLFLISKNFGVRNLALTVPTTSPASSTAPSDTKDWKTFKNADFSFKYPKSYNFASPVILYNFEIKDSVELINYTTLGKGKLILRFDRGYGPDENKNLTKVEQKNYTKEWASSVLDSYKSTEKGEIVVGGVTAWKGIHCPSSESVAPLDANFQCTYHVYIPYGNDVIDIEGHGDLTLQSEIDRILSTFQFTN